MKKMKIFSFVTQLHSTGYHPNKPTSKTELIVGESKDLAKKKRDPLGLNNPFITEIPSMSMCEIFKKLDVDDIDIVDLIELFSILGEGLQMFATDDKEPTRNLMIETDVVEFMKRIKEHLAKNAIA